jgi:hypothetical protein
VSKSRAREPAEASKVDGQDCSPWVGLAARSEIRSMINFPLLVNPHRRHPATMKQYPWFFEATFEQST